MSAPEQFIARSEMIFINRAKIAALQKILRGDPAGAAEN
jgi:hypothetical protein